jgi:hypothetical protein
MRHFHTKVKWTIFLVGLAGLFLFLGIMSNRWLIRSGLVDAHCSVEFVVPDGFHGIFVIREDTKQGLPPDRNGNVIRYHIPDSGVLITKDALPLDVWHSEKAMYQSGSYMPESPQHSGSQNCLYGLATGSDGRSTWLIGTKLECNQYWKDHAVWFRIE